MRYVLLKLNNRCKNLESAKKNLKLVLSKDGSMLDKYGFIQGTDKASLMIKGAYLLPENDLLRHYDFLFSRFREEKFALIEFGCADGASLRTWEQYFVSAEIYGVDISENAKRHEKGRIHVVIGDATSKNTWQT